MRAEPSEALEPEDDGEPANSGWLVSVGFSTGGGTCWMWATAGPQITVRFYDGFPNESADEIELFDPPALLVGGHSAKWDGTRGFIRRLCAALGSPLTSQ